MKYGAGITRKDLMLLKWSVLTLVICLLLASGIVMVTNSIQREATQSLANAQSSLRETRTLVDDIEVEEATVIRFVDRYEQLQRDGVIGTEDRLQLLERFSEIRAQYELFPISVSIEEQKGMPLEYADGISEPGAPVNIRYSRINLSLSLLHEEDLTRLISALLDSPGLYQIEECSIRQSGSNNYLSLGQHFSANCSLLWFTFEVSPATTANSTGRTL